MSNAAYPLLDWEALACAVQESEPTALIGQVTGIVGLAILSQGPAVSMGELCYLYPKHGGQPIPVEVVGFRDGQVVLMPIGDMEGVGPGCEVVATANSLTVGLGPQIVGRVLDGLGRPVDGLPPWRAVDRYPIKNRPPEPMKRQRISEVLATGVRSIDGLLTTGKGQRLGIFAGSGVGKSTLLGMIAKYTSASISVIALIGERGREVRDFIERDLGPEGLKRSVVVAATSDQPAMVRLNGALVATTIAEYFRDQGQDVVLIMDSVTRLCMAQREVGLAVGEPPATRGYPPSVFGLLPKVLERAGCSERGTITGFYSVLVDGDDMNEPITDAVRGILDGHVSLSRSLATQNHYPAVDVLGSISRVMPDLVNQDHKRAAGALRGVLATMREAQDLIDIGAYQPGANPKIDFARNKIDQVRSFLRQTVDDPVVYPEVREQLCRLFEGVDW